MRVTVIVDPTTSTNAPLPTARDLAAAWQESVPSAHTQPVWFPTSIRSFAQGDTHSGRVLSLRQSDTDGHIRSLAQDLAAQVQRGGFSADSGPMSESGELKSSHENNRQCILALDHNIAAPRGWLAWEEFCRASGVPTPLTWGQALTSTVIEKFSDHLRKTVERIEPRNLTVLWDRPTPLTGFHGLSATNALDNVVAPQEAQLQERWLSELAGKIHLPHTSLLAEQSTARARARVDGAAAGGGLAWYLSLVGVRHCPLAPWLWQQQHLTEQCTRSDLIVVVQEQLDARTLQHTAAGLAGAAAQEQAVPVIVLTRECLMNRRELAEHGVAAAYTPTAHDLLGDAQRIARSWKNLL